MKGAMRSSWRRGGGLGEVKTEDVAKNEGSE